MYADCLHALLSACFIFCVLYCLRALFFSCLIISLCFIMRVCFAPSIDTAPLFLISLIYGFSIRLCSHAYLCFFRACLFMCLDWIPLYIPYMQNFDVFSPLLPSHDKSIVIVFIPRYFAKFLLFLGICCFIIPCCFASDFFLYFFIFCNFFYS